MKYCPQCSSEYSDSIDFCAKDGNALVSRNRLCSHCANSVPVDATECPHCHGSLPAASLFQWSKEGDSPRSTPQASAIKGMPPSSTWLWIAGMLLSALAGFLAGGQYQRSDLLQSVQEQVKDVQAKESRIKDLESLLTQAKQDGAANSQQLAELTGKLEQNRKELNAAQQKLAGASREAERLAAAQIAAAPKTSPRQPEPEVRPRGATRPGPMATRPADPIPPSPAAAPARRGGEPGAYETVRPTTVHAEPVNSARVVSQLEKGIVVNVVRATGDWLEVRSKHGNPPGFIRRDDAMLVRPAN